MATVDFFTGFTYKWAQTGNNFAWDDAQYKLGWATIGDTPPTVEQFNRVLQVSDEKSNWLYGQLAAAAAEKGITLSAGDLDSLKNILAAYTPAASETVAGIAEIATQAEVTTGTDDARIVTPLKLATAVPAASTLAAGKIQLATAAEAQAFVNATKAITPDTLASAFKGANQSLAGNGYQKLPGGLIFQWLTVSGSLGGTALATFPITFPNAAFHATSFYIAGVDPGSSSPASIGGTLYGTLATNAVNVRFAPGYLTCRILVWGY